jgi:hypothetical protein
MRGADKQRVIARLAPADSEQWPGNTLSQPAR